MESYASLLLVMPQAFCNKLASLGAAVACTLILIQDVTVHTLHPALQLDLIHVKEAHLS